MNARQATIKRETKETRIAIRLNLDGRGKSSIRTGIPFFDHMLTLFAKHATVDLRLTCRGDLAVDAHHTVEDCGIALGQAVLQALGDKRGLRRYGAGFDPRNPFTGEAYVPMDECLARCVIDFSGRSYLVWKGLDASPIRRSDGGGKEPGRFQRVPLRPGAGIFPGVCQRGPVQPASGTALRRRTASHRGGVVQGVRRTARPAAMHRRRTATPGN